MTTLAQKMIAATILPPVFAMEVGARCAAILSRRAAEALSPGNDLDRSLSPSVDAPRPAAETGEAPVDPFDHATMEAAAKDQADLRAIDGTMTAAGDLAQEVDIAKGEVQDITALVDDLVMEATGSAPRSLEEMLPEQKQVA